MYAKAEKYAYSTFSLRVRWHLIHYDLQQRVIRQHGNGKILAGSLLYLGIQNMRRSSEDRDDRIMDFWEEIEPLEVCRKKESFGGC